MDIKFCGLYVKYIYDNIIDYLRMDDNFAFEENALNIVKKNIESEIFQRCFKSLLYCMNVERVDGKLIGNTPEDRYAEFSNTEHCITSMKDMFPSLERQIYSELKEKCKYLISVTGELEKNISKITTYFFGIEIKKIESVSNSGDWHNDKCVLVFTLDGGSKVVYKPTKGKNLEFLKNVLGFFFEPEYLNLYDFIYSNEGTWVKFIEYKEENDPCIIKQFYKNYGQIIFISYLLGVNDLHYENLIASGQYPIISDVETIFSSYLFFQTHSYDYDAQYNASKQLIYGVMATGLVPIYSMTEYFGGDVSCLSSKGIKLFVEKVMNIYRDDMYIEPQLELINSYNHMPSKSIDPLLYKDSIISGFEKAQETFFARKEEIVEFVVDHINMVESRIILNMTKGYSKIVKIKSDPRYRMMPQTYDDLLVNLKRSNMFNDRVFNHEVFELQKGNIPSFYWCDELNYAYGYCGSEKRSVMDIAKFNKHELKTILDYQTDESMIKRQKKLIIEAIDSNIALGIEYNGLHRFRERDVKVDRNTLRKNIDENVIRGNDGTVSWIGLMVNDKEQLEYAALDWTLYSGLVGLGHVYFSDYITRQDEYAYDMLGKIYQTLEIVMEKGRFDNYNISYYCGLTGIYSFMVKMKSIGITANKKMDHTLYVLQNLIRKNIGISSCYDTLTGIHSAVMYFFSQRSDDLFAEQILQEISKYFVSNFQVQLMERDFNYASFAHGYSGIITSIMCLNRVEPDGNYKEWVNVLWKKETGLYEGDFKWKDMRNAEYLHSHFWCHGSCGIMTARLVWIKYGFLKDGLLEDVREDEIIMQLGKYKTDIVSGKYDSQNYSLCHGNGAFIEFLISYYRVFEDHGTPNTYIDRIIRDAEKHGFSCIGAPGAINAIGFMVGESGIQYMLNRCKHSDLPSLLLAENI